MKIWFDGQCFQTLSRNRGIGRYCAELLRGLKEGSGDLEIHVSLNLSMPEQAQMAYSALESLVGRDNIHVWQGLATTGEAISGYDEARRLSELALVHHVNCIAPDVALSSAPFEGEQDPASPLLPHKLLEPPVAAVFYDAIPKRFPERYLSKPPVKAYYERRLNLYPDFDSLLAISNFSKDEALDLFCDTDCTTIFAGVSPSFLRLLDDMGSQKTADARKRSRVLYVGALDWRKNAGIIPDAIAALPEPLRSTTEFQIVGDHSPHLVEELETRWAAHGLPAGNFQHVGLVSDKDLVTLYRNAGVLVQPSFMEGFGLTALEALICGVPVVAARAGALPEIVQKNGFLFDPRSPLELADRLRPLLDPDEKQPKLGALTRKLKKDFSWTRSAKIASEALHDLAKDKPATPVRSLEERRSQIAQAVDVTKTPMERVTTAFALADPPVERQPRVIIDATMSIYSQAQSGIQRVVRKIAKSALQESDRFESEIFVSYGDDHSGFYDTQGELNERPQKSVASKIQPSPTDHFLALDSSWDFIEHHERYFQQARLRGAQVTSCVYDTVPLKNSAFCARGMSDVFTNWFMRMTSYSTGLICISKAVADEVVEFLHAIDFPRAINVGYWQLGADFSAPVPVQDPAPKIAKAQFLMVGTLEPRKGHRLGLEAFEQLWARGVDAELVIAGRYGWSANDLIARMRAHPEYGRRLKWFSDASDEQLSRLYAECDCLIAASYAEGFGLPIVEAGHMGKPVIASDIPVFREVSAGASGASFFTLGDAGDLADAVERFMQSMDKPAKPESAAPTDWPSWAESAAQLVGILERGDWYTRYVPEYSEAFVSAHDTNNQSLREPIDPLGRDSLLRIVAPPEVTDDPNTIKVVVAVTNKSDIPWPGAGIRGAKAVSLGYHVLDGNGEVLCYENIRTVVPLVIAPGETQYMAIYISETWRRNGGKFIDIELMQEGVAWWGDPLRIEI
ncbi:MAG: glycosyltransferase family 1 protein [Pseudomonadota bacterium]